MALQPVSCRCLRVQHEMLTPKCSISSITFWQKTWANLNTLATFACFYLMRIVRLIQLEHLPLNVECRLVWSRDQLCFEPLVQVKLLARTLGPSLELSHSQDVRQLSHPARRNGVNRTEPSNLSSLSSFTRTNTSGTRWYKYKSIDFIVSFLGPSVGFGKSSHLSSQLYHVQSYFLALFDQTRICLKLGYPGFRYPRLGYP